DAETGEVGDGRGGGAEGGVGGTQPRGGQRGELARHAQHRQAVGAVRRDLDLQHVIVETELLHEIGADGGVAVEQQQAGFVLLAEAELALGAQDALRFDAVDLLGADGAEARQRCARRSECGACAGTRVRRAAHDGEALRAPAAHAAEHEPMAAALAQLALDGLDLADDDAAQPVGGERRDARYFDAGVDEAIRGVLRRKLQRDELANPAVRNFHANCPRKRRSFSKNSRMSSTPYLSMAMRSMPMPNAQPVTSSGS